MAIFHRRFHRFIQTFPRLIAASLILFYSIYPFTAFAAASATWSFVSVSGQRLNASGGIEALYKFKNTATGVVRSAYGAMTTAEIGGAARFVISRGLVGFAAVTALSEGLNYYYASGAAPLHQINPNTLVLSNPAGGKSVPVPNWGTSYCGVAASWLIASYAAGGQNGYTAVSNPQSLSDWCSVQYSALGALGLSITLKNPAGSSVTNTVFPDTYDQTKVGTVSPNVYTPNDAAYGADLMSNVTPSTISKVSPLLNYSDTYQSPAATRAINSLNADATQPAIDPPFTDTTSQALSPATTNTGTGTGSGTTTGTSTLPEFCTWASTICDAITWLKTDPVADTATPVQITDTTQKDLNGFDINKSYIRFSGSCPPDKDISMTIMGSNVHYSFSYQPICDFAQGIAPIVVGSAMLSGAYIVSGAFRRGD